VIPLLEYCSQVWSPSAIGDILRLESVQRSFTKSLYLCESLSYKDRLLKCKLKSLEYRRLFVDLTLFYKITNNLIKIDFGDVIAKVDSVTRGHSKRFVVPLARKNCRSYFFLNRTIPVWNKLSERTVSAGSLNDFRKWLLCDKFSEILVFYYY